MRIAFLIALAGCTESHDPTAFARSLAGKIENREANVPPACYLKTAGRSNTCWVCHAVPLDPNGQLDVDLQAEYGFSEYASTNRWTNLFIDRRAAGGDTEAAIFEYVREDNYRPLVRSLRELDGYRGWIPDLDFDRGFDEDGFARDGSGWRAIRYKPFPGFWPKSGSWGDVFIRLPAKFRSHYRENLALLESAIVRPGEVLPERYLGDAGDVRVRRYIYPEGTELLHSVRYLDPDADRMMAARMKELRYQKKVRELDAWALARAYDREQAEKEEGALPRPVVATGLGLRTDFGWQLLGYIEDAEGRLRLQTEEEHRSCLGCHSNLGITVDQTFAFPRKLPGAEGWRWQDLAGQHDVPQLGQARPEIEVYLERAAGAVQLRYSDDLASMLSPERQEAIDLDRAYRAIVRAQSFTLGRDPTIHPSRDHWLRIEALSTGLRESGRIHRDGRLHLDFASSARPL